ncbi:MAG: hypothetical protein U0746_12950 [Gemmataceae bacterium]
MPKSCAGCGFYDATGEVATCEKCDRPLQTTFLPPPGADTGPTITWGPPLATPQTARYSSIGPGSFDGIGSLFRYRFLIGIVVAPVLVGLRLAFGLGNTTDVEQRYDKVQIGMTTTQVEQILYSDTGQRPTHRSRQFTQDGRGVMTYTKNGATVRVTFKNGRVSYKAIIDDGDVVDDEGIEDR